MSTSTSTSTPTNDDHAVPWAPVCTVLAGLFMAVLDAFIVIVAGPRVRADLGAGAGELQWVLAGYQLSYAVGLVTAGRVADAVGRRRVFLTGTALFTATSALCALSPTPGALIAARVAQGLGAAMMVPQVFATITVLVPAQARSRAFGVVGVVMGLASVGGQVIGGLLVGADLFDSSWRSVFAVNVPIGLLILVLAGRLVPETRAERRRRLDLAGVLLLAAALLLLTYPLIQGREHHWPSWMLLLLGVSPLAFVVFAVTERHVERRGGDPLLRLAMFRQRSFSVGLLLVAATYAVIYSYYLALAVVMQDGLGLSALQSGLVYAPAAAMFFVFSMVAGRLVPRFGRRVLEVAAVVLAVGYLATAVTLWWADRISPGLVIPSLMLQGVGGGLLLTPSLNAVLARVEAHDVGAASGALSTAQQVGAALGVAVIGGLFFAAYDPVGEGRMAAATHGFAVASVAVLVTTVVSLGLVLAMPRTARSGS